MFGFLCVVASLGTLAHAAPTDWEGSFNDSIYGGEIRVCVDYSASTSKYYAQALFSDLGYMRGEISASDVWTGQYYMAGEEARRGSFSLTLTVGAPTTFTGSFTENSGATYDVTETKVRSAVPDDIDCFRTDLDLVTGAESFSFTGEWINGIRVLYADDATDLVFGSYNYGPENLPGYHIGPVYLNGQVMCCNWLEVGDWNGLYLFVAKNTTNFYSFWWDYDRVSDFDYSNRNSSSYFGHRENKYDDGTSALTTIDDGNENSCYSLATLDEEATCLEGDDNDCSDEETLVIVLGSDLGVVLLAFVVLVWQYLKIRNELVEKNSLAKNAL